MIFNFTIYGILVEIFNFTLLHIACKLGNIELVKYLISLDKIEITATTIYILIYFIKFNNQFNSGILTCRIEFHIIAYCMQIR